MDALSALTSWRQWANSSGTVSSWVTSPLIEGLHTAELQGGVNDGLYQYMGLGGGSYTVSGWVKVQSGAVHLGLAWNGGGAAALAEEPEHAGARRLGLRPRLLRPPARGAGGDAAQ